MRSGRFTLVPKAVLQLMILTNGFLLAVVMVLLCSCGARDKVQAARSLEEAKKLAAEKNTWIVAEFWRHG